MDLELRRHGCPSSWTYRDLDQRQLEIFERIQKGGAGALLLSEVTPVITLGRRTPASDLLFGAEQFQTQGIDTYVTGRGGLATYHGPGQWVFFAVERLEVLTGDRRGVRRAVEGLLEIALQVGRKKLGSEVEIRTGCDTGVWTSRGKLASVGVQIKQGILLHGMAFNAFRTETSFLGIRPCGLDATADFLLDRMGVREQDREVEFVDLGNDIAQLARQQFERT